MDRAGDRISEGLQSALNDGDRGSLDGAGSHPEAAGSSEESAAFDPNPYDGQPGDAGLDAADLAGAESGIDSEVVLTPRADEAPDPDALRARLDLETLPTSKRYPPWNPPMPERVALGRLLFFDPILSGERDVACGTCHHPDLGWADGRQLPVGVAGGHYHPTALGPDRVTGISAMSGQPVGMTPRNAPTVLNTAFNGFFSPRPEFLSLMFWDGRVENGLEEQALKPPTSRVEMAGDAYNKDQALDIIVARLRGVAEYKALFAQAFPEAEDATAAISSENLGMALAAFQRELVTPDSAYDRFIAGDDGALSPAQLRGLDLFFGQAACEACHFGPMLSDFSFHIQGVAQIGPGRPETPGDDIGRAEVTGRDEDRYAFRTPGLRNVALTAPYMHDGAHNSLHEVVEFYDRGGNDLKLAKESIDVRIFPLGLDQRQRDDLVAFMESLTGKLPNVTVPERVPSGLVPLFGLPADRAAD
jgi:cytochrome c peroxidase